MLSAHVDRYLALRRTLGYQLHNTGRNLQAFAAFASDQGDTHIRAATAVQCKRPAKPVSMKPAADVQWAGV